jgi:hypothetical protein
LAFIINYFPIEDKAIFNYREKLCLQLEKNNAGMKGRSTRGWRKFGIRGKR